MFALRRGILGPAAARIPFLFRSNLAATTERAAASSLLDERRRAIAIPSAERRGIICAPVHPPRSVIDVDGDVDDGSSISPTALDRATRLLFDGATAAADDSVVVRLVLAAAVSSSWIGSVLNDGLFRISTLKRRRKMMNKHKLRKRRKKNRMKNKK